MLFHIFASPPFMSAYQILEWIRCSTGYAAVWNSSRLW